MEGGFGGEGEEGVACLRGRATTAVALVIMSNVSISISIIECCIELLSDTHLYGSAGEAFFVRAFTFHPLCNKSAGYWRKQFTFTTESHEDRLCRGNHMGQVLARHKLSEGYL